jgi:hypothetical protein
MGDSKLADHIWQLLFSSKCEESDNPGDLRSPVDPPILPSSVRHPPGAFLFVGRAQLEYQVVSNRMRRVFLKSGHYDNTLNRCLLL